MIALRILAVCLGFIITAAAMLPLRFALAIADPSSAGLTHANASGPVWNGVIRAADWRGLPLGDMRVAMQPLDLVTGQIGVAFQASGPVSSGVMKGSGATWRFERLNGRIALDQIASGLPPEAAVFLTAASLTPSPQGCTAASGQVTVDGLPSPAPATLEGSLRCDAGDLAVSLAAPQGGGAIDIRISLTGPDAPRASATSEDSVMQALIDQLGLPGPRS